MNAIRYMAAVALAALLTVPAAADWENTHWGATVDQTIAAVGGDTAKAKPRKGNSVFDQDLRARGTADYDGVKVDRLFFFDKSGGLSVVKLQPRPEDCDAFVAAARKRLGPAKQAENRTLMNVLETHRAIWADQDANVAILLFDLHGSGEISRLCHVTYQPYGDGTPGLRGPDGKTRPLSPEPSTSSGPDT